MSRPKVISREIEKVIYEVTLKVITERGTAQYTTEYVSRYEDGRTEKAVKAEVTEYLKNKGRVVDIEEVKREVKVYECTVRQFMSIARESKRQPSKDTEPEPEAEPESNEG